ncbi:MAG: methionyl-tRNA formyltransferase [Candidatus Ryanbacteria bacterium RIFCSPHIGHO2_12_FULL_47_12b]|uniref:Methionyl-tRNA formyltransferase n=1 Tax=Candidatus Ryanbacteria bacterium RIFCSPLOWO2_02_FULL_47_14 TaxID=1802129 RepID=A0A1G2H2L8_9BACT|nr:MAG: Methionyl-tRNA formyltransferase [Parcubacteria group bacterium GW2011_GWA2_47_10b]OGZ46650.1 MAG: methionyl-tRNA formyltransferase [Candidatus Ryanbacteria bacterium RIFCSPHIGHO2_01_FULL_48_80]OGZ50476.1 MAG: methionyl-tRNA formyltransferase [Candidatus Ryanbacteria bacterium RIFCSPHIGHO2_02_FULL_47_25]OGZ53010.1 MAG: methionyl-tRNA formyltransferase [Candidatus Ryanbacteria bacterium RIFCSPLOWO2_01_FULL_47_79]OGZ53350.1 MAG: methionyl-tRNA formyltransferase [Candidatus Ryanbacteria ba
MKTPSIVFFGSSEFSIPVLEALLEHRYYLAGVITKPGPVEKYLQTHKIPMLASPKKSDLFVIASFGKILPSNILALPLRGTLNVHPSLLPQYRGPSPIQTAILAGDSKTGVTIMLTDTQVDHGPILAQRELTIEPNDTFLTLGDKLAKIGGNLLAEIILPWVAGKLQTHEQDHARATFTKLVKKENGKINWHDRTENINRSIRAYTPWPSAWTQLNDKHVKILKATTKIETQRTLGPGELMLEHNNLLVGCGDGILIIDSIQPEGKSIMSGSAFAHGYLKQSTRTFS